MRWQEKGIVGFRFDEVTMRICCNNLFVLPQWKVTNLHSHFLQKMERPKDTTEKINENWKHSHESPSVDSVNYLKTKNVVVILYFLLGQKSKFQCKLKFIRWEKFAFWLLICKIGFWCSSKVFIMWHWMLLQMFIIYKQQ